jgi:hypothetical protein
MTNPPKADQSNGMTPTSSHWRTVEQTPGFLYRLSREHPLAIYNPGGEL